MTEREASLRETLRQQGHEVPPDVTLVGAFDSGAERVRAADPAVEAAVARAQAQRICGRHRVVGQLGAGGMGEVYEAMDADLNRRVAAKVMRGGDDPYALAKFVVEAQVTGQLEHPAIVPVYELGTSERGRAYFTMQAVEGRTLTEVVAAGDRTLRQRLEIFARICDAVAYAHSRGVIHRDLKPDNVMIGAFGEVLLMDWGLAKVTGRDDVAGRAVTPDLTGLGDASVLRSVDGMVMGTPAFMPPEQAEGRVADIDERSDVYGLGAILYEVLTGRPPFEGDLFSVLEAVADGQLVPPRALVQDLPRELDALVCRAMAHDADRRYASVVALRADVDAYLEGRLLEAARYGPLQRVAKWVGRHKGAVAAAIAVVGVAVALLGHQAYARRTARSAARHAVREALGRLAPLAELRAAVAAGVVDEQGWRRRLPNYLGAVAATERALRLEPDEAGLRTQRLAAGEALGLAAILSGDLTLAEHAFGQLRHVGGSERRVRALRAAVERARQTRDQAARRAREARLAREASRLDAILAALAERLEVSWVLEDRLFEVVAFDDRQTAARLAAALAPLVELARREGRGARFTAGQLRVARFCCRALGRIDRPESFEALVPLVEAVWHEELIGEAGIALCRVGGARAWPHLLEMGRRIGFQTRPFQRIAPYLQRLPAPSGGGSGSDAMAAQLALAQVHAFRAEWGEVVRLLTAVLRADPRHYRARHDRALALRRLRRPDEARADLDRVIADYPERAEARVSRAVLRSSLGDRKGALEDYDVALRLEPRNARTLSNRAMVRQKLGDARGALRDLDQAVALDPSYPGAWTNRGLLRRALGQFEGARSDLDRAIRLAPGDPDLYVNRGSLRQRQGDVDGAWADYRAAIELDPTHATARYNRGTILQARRDYGGAITEYTQALRARPNYARARISRGMAYREKKDLAAAIEDLTEGLRLDPEIWQGWLAYAHALAASDRIPEAIEALLRGRERAPASMRGRFDSLLDKLR